MTIREAILKSLNELKTLSTYNDVYNHSFKESKTPKSTISASLCTFIKNNDTRVGRIKGNGNFYLYYLTKHEQYLNLDVPLISNSKEISINKSKDYQERDLHMLLSSYLKGNNVFSKTIFHEKSKMDTSRYDWD